MKPNPKIDRLIESIAKQNSHVSRTVDGIVENVSSQPDAELRSDWNEVKKSSELIVIQDLVFGENGSEEAKQMPKPNRKTDGRKSKHEGQNG